MENKNERPVRIGVVAERTEMSIPTLRHYDEVGLVTPSARSEGGFRLYTEEDVQRILVIRRMKPLEFSLTQMMVLLDAVDVCKDPGAPSTARQTARAVLVDFHTQSQEAMARIEKRLGYAAELTTILAQQISDSR